MYNFHSFELATSYCNNLYIFLYTNSNLLFTLVQYACLENKSCTFRNQFHTRMYTSSYPYIQSETATLYINIQSFFTIFSL